MPAPTLSLTVLLFALGATQLMGCHGNRGTATTQQTALDDISNDANSDSYTQEDYLDMQDPEPELPATETGDDISTALSTMPRIVMTPEFCAIWNPEFDHRGKLCCVKTNWRGHRRPKQCAPTRRRGNFCNELTEAQKLMTGEHLELLNQEFISTGRMDSLGSDQAFCTTNNGFLAHGVALLPTPENRVMLNNPWRCANFGTTGLVLALHRLGKAIHERFSSSDGTGKGVRLVVGDISAPKGGCLATRRGSHSGHTNGLDADVAFLNSPLGERESPRIFTNRMDYELNWWMLQKLVEVSPVCVRHIFLDRKHIRGLHKIAQHHPLWPKIRSVLQHYGGHRNHFHIRLGLRRTKDAEFRCKWL